MREGSTLFSQSDLLPFPLSFSVSPLFYPGKGGWGNPIVVDPRFVQSRMTGTGTGIVLVTVTIAVAVTVDAVGPVAFSIILVSY